MSFCNEQKNEIITAPIKNACCRRALLSGVLAAGGELADGFVQIRITDENVRRFVCSLITEVYTNEPEIINSEKGGRGKIIRFKSNSAKKFIAEIENSDNLMYSPRCNFCKSAFLRGVFLAAGRTTSPDKQYMLEFSFKRPAKMAAHFADMGLDFKVANRGGKDIVYTKNSTYIEDFFGLAAMNGTAFSIMNTKIEGELKNNANRVANCETNNIDKAVNTAMRQIAVITALEEAGMLGSLSDELALTARLRLEYSSLSLSQLAAKFTPSISKPGLSHRLNKIEEIGRKMLENLK